MTNYRRKRLWTIIKKDTFLILAEVVIVLLISFLSAYIFYELSLLLKADELDKFDLYYTTMIRADTSPPVEVIMRTATFIGNAEAVSVLAMLTIVYFLFINPQRWYSIKIPVVCIGSISLNLFLKYLYERPRPEVSYMIEAVGLSFPSGHAMFSFSFFGLLIYIIWHYRGSIAFKILTTVVLVTIILLIGISRVYLGVHYPSDVLAGFAAGFSWLLICLLVLRRIEHFIKSRALKRADQAGRAPYIS